MMIGFIYNQIGSKDSNSPNSTEKRETALEPFPFQLIFVISSEVCFHHLLPGLVRDGDIGIQGLFDHLSRRIQVIDIQQITHLYPIQIDRSTSRNHLSVNNFHSTRRPASSTQRRLFAKQPHICPPMGMQNAPSGAPRADIGQWRTATIDTTRTRPLPVRLFGEIPSMLRG